MRKGVRGRGKSAKYRAGEAVRKEGKKGKRNIGKGGERKDGERKGAVRGMKEIWKRAKEEKKKGMGEKGRK